MSKRKRERGDENISRYTRTATHIDWKAKKNEHRHFPKNANPPPVYIRSHMVSKIAMELAAGQLQRMAYSCEDCPYARARRWPMGQLDDGTQRPLISVLLASAMQASMDGRFTTVSDVLTQGQMTSPLKLESGTGTPLKLHVN